MQLNQSLISELESESKSTRKILERVPLEKAGWKPHEKSTPLGRLATHIAELQGRIDLILNTDEHDFAKTGYSYKVAASSKELLGIFEENCSKSLNALRSATDESFNKNWTLRNGEKIFFSLPKLTAIRSSVFNHIYHHRAQLGVYLRLLEVPLPSIYGPTADEPM